MTLALFLVCLLSMLMGAVSLWLYLKLRAELRQVTLKGVNSQQISEMTAALSARLAVCESRLDRADRARKDHADWVSQAQSLNLNRRGQVLRLHRRGESAAEIASSLRMGQGEVKLMIKVYELNRGISGPPENQL